MEVKIAGLEQSVRSTTLQLEALQNRRFNAYLRSNFNLCFTYDRVI